ncbi:MAG TPA: iron-sulfur cluster assembly scaffold protein [Patescibacteria group bacterium]|nr:iron-sulfur cluster assembly scaffold protein [Patescibacteria group bacterium]
MKKNKDVISQNNKESWLYSATVKEHFFHPRNVQLKNPKAGEFNGVGTVGSPACGDVMTIWIKVDLKTKRIKKCTWRTFGCASAIASTSMLSAMVTRRGGLKLADAEKLTPKDILKELGGLPARKIHCSVLGDQALRAAIQDFNKIGQNQKSKCKILVSR